MNLSRHLVFASFAVMALRIGVEVRADDAPLPPAQVEFFEQKIRPVLVAECYECHSTEKQKGGLALHSRDALRQGGDSGPAIVPGAPEKSLLITSITHADPDLKMPSKAPKLDDSVIADFTAWVKMGAPDPRTQPDAKPASDAESWAQTLAVRSQWWSFKPLKTTPSPTPKNAAWSDHPIDRFLLTAMEARGLAPAADAEPRALIRRLHFALTGLPPTPEEVEAFVRDHRSPITDHHSPVTAATDRLLASPAFGERWARHWMDLARYAETYGSEHDYLNPHAWRYRDYLIRAFNSDLPYDRFVQEQIAGDELWPDDPDAWVATGFARLGAWDGMSKEPEQQWQDFLNDATDAVGSVFLGVTVGCARCHDHKYDVISQRDYFRLQACFAGVKREVQPMKVRMTEPDFVTSALAKDEAELAPLRQERDELLREARETLEKEQAPAKEGEKPKKLSDGDVLKKADALHGGRATKLNAQIKELERRVSLHEQKAEAVFAGGQKRATHLLHGGELSRRGPEVKPGFVEAMMPAGAPVELAGNAPRRTSFARWLTSPEHPLTARVMVNRLWQHHFGVGLVATPSDFGRNGRPPAHPELLDWLAREFVREGWSLKRMHRLMMTSAAYRRSSAHDPGAFSKDPENRLLWRKDRRRLEGEAIRDTILAVSGSLNPAMGGPGVYAKLPPGVNVEFPNNDKELSWGVGTPADDRRRSIYLFQRRTLTFPLLEVFDSAPMSQSCAVRAHTTVAPQTLALFNGEFAREAARDFAGRLHREAGDEAPRQIERAFLTAFARQPADSERAAAESFLTTQSSIRAAAPDPARAALADFCHVLLNTNELIYLD